MKQLKPMTWRLWAVAVTLLTLALAGCGGGSSNSQTQTVSTTTGTISTTSGNSGASALSLQAPAGVTLSIPADTVLSDNSGNPVSGSIATSVSYSTTAGDLPAAAAALPSGASLVAFADVALTGGGTSVKNFSKPVSLTFKVPAAAAGDAVVIYSFDAGTGQWSFAGTEIVDAEGNVSTGVRHLSIWGLFKSGTPPPVKPSGLTGAAGDAQATLIWSEVSGATSYNIYYGTSAGVTKANGTKVAGAVSGQAVTGLSNGTGYFFVVTAVNAAGESVVSSEVSVTPVLPPPGRPSGIVVSAGDGKVTVTWNGVAGATSYNIYYGTSAGVTKNNGTKLAGVTAPQQITGLTNGQSYFFVVSAESAAGEGALSSEKSATPAAAPQAPGSPTQVAVTPGAGQVTVSWLDTVPGATSYNVYYLQSAATPTTATVIATGLKVGSATSPVTVTGLSAGSNYWFSVTAVNAGGESGGQTNPKKAVPL